MKFINSIICNMSKYSKISKCSQFYYFLIFVELSFQETSKYTPTQVVHEQGEKDLPCLRAEVGTCRLIQNSVDAEVSHGNVGGLR